MITHTRRYSRKLDRFLTYTQGCSRTTLSVTPSAYAPPRIIPCSINESSRTTKLDVLLAAHLLLLLDPPFPDPLISTLLAESYPILVSHARHIQAAASESPFTVVGNIHSYSLGFSILQWPRHGHQTKKKPRTKTAEDVHFDRMRWGWMALAVTGVFFYLWTAGIRISVLADPAEGGGDVLEEDAEMDVEGQLREEKLET
jgi:hypothetical protein